MINLASLTSQHEAVTVSHCTDVICLFSVPNLFSITEDDSSGPLITREVNKTLDFLRNVEYEKDNLEIICCDAENVWSWGWQSVGDTETWDVILPSTTTSTSLHSGHSTPPGRPAVFAKPGGEKLPPDLLRVEIGTTREKITLTFLWLLTSHQGDEQTLRKTKSCSDTIGYKMVENKINNTENNGWIWCTLVLLYHEKCFTFSLSSYSSIALVHLKSNINWIHFAGLFLEFRFTNK